MKVAEASGSTSRSAGEMGTTPPGSNHDNDRTKKPGDATRDVRDPDVTTAKTDHVDKGSRHHANGGDGTGTPNFLPPHHGRSGNHHQHSLRSDTYLRQALTSPYNHRSDKSRNQLAEKYGSSSSSPYDHNYKEAGSGYGHQASSPLRSASSSHFPGSPHRDDRAGLKGHHDGVYEGKLGDSEGGAGATNMPVFKTPKTAKWMHFGSPDGAMKERALSGSSSPLVVRRQQQ